MIVFEKILDRVVLILRLTIISTSLGSKAKEADCSVNVIVIAGTRRKLEMWIM